MGLVFLEMKGPYSIADSDCFSHCKVVKGYSAFLKKEYDGRAEMENAELIAGPDRYLIIRGEKDFRTSPERPVGLCFAI